MGVLPPSQAIAHGHRAVIADHWERVEHYSCIETELRVQGEVYELSNWRPAFPIKRLEDHLQKPQLVLRQLLAQHPVHAADTSQQTRLPLASIE